MSVVHLIDTLTEWARQNVCEQIKLKAPPPNTDPNDAGYEYDLVTPAAFPMYIPTAEKLPPNVHSPFPSVCVGFMTGKDTPASGEGSVKVQLFFSTWDPGIHSKDIFMPQADGSFKRWSGADAEAYFKLNADGWRDAWNFVDIALRAVESVTHIGQYTVDRKQPIEFGPLAEQEGVPNLYPKWFSWVSFTVNYPLRRNIQDFQNFL